MKITTLPPEPAEAQYVIQLSRQDLLYIAACMGVAGPMEVRGWYNRRYLPVDHSSVTGAGGQLIYRQITQMLEVA